MNEQMYIDLLEKELVPAMGCTEPIAIAFACAKAKEILNDEVVQVDIFASGSIIKNVKSVTVPNTEGKKGIQSAAAIGIVAGNPDLSLEVLSKVDKEQIKIMNEFMEQVPIKVHHLKTHCTLDIVVKLASKEHNCVLRIQDEHDNIVYVEKDEQVVFDKSTSADNKDLLDQIEFSMQDIFDFANIVDLEKVKPCLDRQIEYNMKIATEGLNHSYGANIGSILLSQNPDSISNMAKAYAAAGSDARMSGCELPVIINSGSGNQGMTVSLSVVIYARELKKSKDLLYRALLISNLVALYQKKYIGRLSAFCGAVSAGAAAGAGIAYLLDQSLDTICHTIVNALAITSGLLCDGAKPSCAAKIAASVDAGIMGCMMYKENGSQFYRGEGIVAKNTDETIRGVGHIAKDGMKETNEEIIKLMISDLDGNK